jgi:hypothetical protein
MLHDALTIAGLILELGAIPDAINAGIYMIQGDWKNAGISAIAMIPVFGGAANAGKLGEKTVLKVSGEAVEKVGAKDLGTAFKEANAAEAAKLAEEAKAAKAVGAVAEEVKLSSQEYEAALKMVFPSKYADPVAKLVDDIGQKAGKRAMENPKFVKAIEEGNWTLEAEKTLQSGAGGGRSDLLLSGPGGELVEFDWKTSGKSALSSSSRKEMAKHAGQIKVHIGGQLSTQESRSWVDYVRSFL